MTELTSTVDNIDSDQGGVAEFFDLLGPEQFAAYQAELVEALETGSDPGLFWAKWIDVVVERTPPETDWDIALGFGAAVANLLKIALNETPETTVEAHD